MEPPRTQNAPTGKKIVINSARGPANNGAFSERDPSGEPMKGMQMSQAILSYIVKHRVIKDNWKTYEYYWCYYYDCKERMDCKDRTDCKDGMDYKDKTD